MEKKNQRASKTPDYVRRSNIFEFIRAGSDTFNRAWPEIAGVTLVFVVSLVCLALFPIFGIALVLFASGFLSIGYIQFFLKTIRGKNPPVETIFMSWRQMLSAFALRVVMVIYVALWSLLLLVPGIIAALNFSFSMTIMSENPKIKAFEAIERSRELVKGYRFEIFNTYLITIIFMVFIFLASLSVPLVFAIFVSMQLWVVFVVAACLCVVVSSVLLFPYFQITLSLIYEEAIKTRKAQKKSSKKEKKIVSPS